MIFVRVVVLLIPAFCLLILASIASLECTKKVKPMGARRVYGGESVPIDDYPYQVQIVRNKPGRRVLFSSCGGAIIAKNIILTAGHCFVKGDFQPMQYLVRAGTSYRNGLAGSIHNVTKILSHDMYSSNRRAHSTNDVALAWVEPSFTFDDTRAAVPLASTPAKGGDTAVSSGWGMMDKAATKRPKKMRAVKLTVIDRNRCNTETKWKGRIASNNFCAGVKTYNAASCKGDSGGPLVSGGRLIGVVSWGSSSSCISEGKPSVYANVTHYIPWVKMHTEGMGVTYL